MCAINSPGENSVECYNINIFLLPNFFMATNQIRAIYYAKMYVLVKTCVLQACRNLHFISIGASLFAVFQQCGALRVFALS